MKINCLFCQLVNGDQPAHVVFQNEFITCFLDIDPINEGHVLIVTKKHVIELDDLDQVTANHVMQAAILITKAIKKLYQPDGVSLMQNGGHFNDVKHFHMHVFPRYKNDGFGWTDSIELVCDLDKIKIALQDTLKQLESL